MNLFYYITKIFMPFKKGAIDTVFYLGTIFAIGEISFSNIQLAFSLLFFSLILDFCTGVYASFVEYLSKYPIKSFKEKFSAFFFEVLESNKIRKSILKTITYFIVTILSYFIETVFFMETVPTQEPKDKLSITIWIIFICTGIELYSAIFENVKRAGFDLKHKLLNTIKEIKILVKEIKDFFISIK